MLMLALPTLAFAAPSPSNQQASDTGAAGVVATATFNGNVTVAKTDTQASNVKLTGAEKVLASFEINAEGVSESNPLTLTFNAGSQYAGAKAKIFADHKDSTEVKEVTVASDGSVTAKFTKNSVFTLVVDPTTATSAAANASSTSPVTGLDITGVAGVTAVAAVAAGCVFVALRKKTNE